MANIAVRVDGAQVASYVSKPIRLVGTVVETGEGMVVLAATDNTKVVVKTPNPEVYSHVMEVIGEVSPDGCVDAIFSTPFGPNFDLANYKQCLELVRKYPDVLAP